MSFRSITRPGPRLVCPWCDTRRATYAYARRAAGALRRDGPKRRRPFFVEHAGPDRMCPGSVYDAKRARTGHRREAA